MSGGNVPHDDHVNMSIRELISKAKDVGIRQGDLIVIALLLALSVMLLCFGKIDRQEGAAVRVCVDGQEMAVLPLDTDAIYEVPGGCGNVLEITGGKVHMQHADCPDESCVGQGFIFRTGECIVCLPGRVTATVVSGDDSVQLDAVAY